MNSYDTIKIPDGSIVDIIHLMPGMIFHLKEFSGK
jgi:hypothetical protein